jgi:hypothetical protein
MANVWIRRIANEEKEKFIGKDNTMSGLQELRSNDDVPGEGTLNGSFPS